MEHGTPMALFVYPPVDSEPAPIFIVVPKFVEMATKLFATTFLLINRSGPSAKTREVVITIKRATDGLKAASAQIQKNTKARIEILGCMKVAKDNATAAYQISELPSFFSTRAENLRNAPRAIKKNEAALTSYPIAGALSAKVGLSAKINVVGQNNLLKMVFCIWQEK